RSTPGATPAQSTMTVRGRAPSSNPEAKRAFRRVVASVSPNEGRLTDLAGEYRAVTAVARIGLDLVARDHGGYTQRNPMSSRGLLVSSRAHTLSSPASVERNEPPAAKLLPSSSTHSAALPD